MVLVVVGGHFRVSMKGGWGPIPLFMAVDKCVAVGGCVGALVTGRGLDREGKMCWSRAGKELLLLLLLVGSWCGG